jgi:hypothetical protein
MPRLLRSDGEFGLRVVGRGLPSGSAFAVFAPGRGKPRPYKVWGGVDKERKRIR